MIDQFVSAATNASAVLVAAHRLADDEFGRLTLCIVITMIVIALGRAFTSSPFVLDHAAQDPIPRRQSLTSAIVGGARMSAVLAACFAAAATLVGDEWDRLVLLLAVGTTAAVLQDLARFAFFVVGPAWGAALSDAVWFAAFVGPAVLLPSAVDTPEALLGLWLAGAAIGGCCAWLVLRRSAIPTTHRLRSQWIAPHLRLSLNVLGDSGLLTIYGYSIPLIIALIAGLDDAGHYRLAQIFVGPVLILVASMTLDMLPRLVQRAHRGEAIVGPAARAGGSIALFALCVALGAAVVPDDWMTALVGENWTDAGAVTVVLALSAATTAISGCALLVIRAAGAQARLTRMRAAMFPMHLALVLAGAAIAGAIGTAVGLLIGNTISIVPWWLLALRTAPRSGDGPPGRVTSLALPSEIGEG